MNFGRSGSGVGRLTHDHLVELYGGDLNKRAEAGEIDPGTVRRYQDALRHYLAFVARSGSSGRVDDIRRVDREFQLALAAHLQSTLITSNGRAAGERRRMNRPDFVLDVVRSLYRWAADPQRGNLLGNGFVNPFNRSAEQRRLVRQDPTAEPPITLSMAATFLLACDPWQLPLFSGLALWGLRPSELIWLFREDIAEEWLAVRCHPDLEYYTKGRRDKRMPLLEEIELWPRPSAVGEGLLFRSRNASSQPVASLANIIEEYRRRAAKVSTIVERRKVRDQVVRHCGGLSYDQIEQEFHQVANRLDWPRTATLKGFRHLFATSLENGGMPEFYRRYLMGQSAGRSAIVTYFYCSKLSPLLNAQGR